MPDEPKSKVVAFPSDPTSIFDDLAKLRKESKLTVKRKPLLTNISVGKPANNLFFRVNDDPEMRLEDQAVVRARDGSRDVYYFLQPHMKEHSKLTKRYLPTTIYLVTTWPGGAPLLWPVVTDTGFPAWRSAQKAALAAMAQWVQISWNEERGDYNVEPAEGIDLDPIWPTEPFAQLLKVGFSDCVIDNENHPYVQQLRRGVID